MERSIKMSVGTNFSEILDFIKRGYKAKRKGWNSDEQFLFLVKGSVFKVNRAPLMGIYPEGTEIEYQSRIDMRTSQGNVVPWTASQTDILAEDWVIVA